MHTRSCRPLQTRHAGSLDAKRDRALQGTARRWRPPGASWRTPTLAARRPRSRRWTAPPQTRCARRPAWAATPRSRPSTTARSTACSEVCTLATPATAVVLHLHVLHFCWHAGPSASCAHVAGAGITLWHKMAGCMTHPQGCMQHSCLPTVARLTSEFGA